MLSAFDRGPREFTAIATNDVIAWQLPRDQYVRMLLEVPEVGADPLEMVATVRCLRQLKTSGAIATHRGGITVLDAQELSTFQARNYW